MHSCVSLMTLLPKYYCPGLCSVGTSGDFPFFFFPSVYSAGNDVTLSYASLFFLQPSHLVEAL